MVACRSWKGWMFSAALNPSSSVAPWLTPGLMPAPVKTAVKPPGLWSRPLAPFWNIGMRPNSVHQRIKVSLSRPRCLRSLIRAAEG